MCRLAPVLCAGACLPEPVDLIVLPELLMSSRSPDEAGDQGGLHDVESLHTLASECDCMVAGTVIERDGAQLYHTAVLLDRDRIWGTQRKRHLTAEDAGWATAGTEPFGTIDTPLGRIGLVTGYDACFFETLRVLATLGADLVCIPANLPWSFSHRIADSQRVWTFWQSKAWESCVALAVANYACPGSSASSGIWVPEVREDRSREAITQSDAGEMVVQNLDTHSRYIREKRGLGWRRLHWYKPLVVVGSTHP